MPCAAVGGAVFRGCRPRHSRRSRARAAGCERAHYDFYEPAGDLIDFVGDLIDFVGDLIDFVGDLVYNLFVHIKLLELDHDLHYERSDRDDDIDDGRTYLRHRAHTAQSRLLAGQG